MGENAPIAFALTVGSGLATALGAAVVYSSTLVKLANTGFLSGALAFSAGVMVFVSFTEIFHHALEGFEEAGHEGGIGFLFASLSFFLGIVLIKIIDKCVSLMEGRDRCNSDLNEEELKKVQNMVAGTATVAVDDCEASACAKDCGKEPLNKDAPMTLAQGREQQKILRTSFLTAVGIAIHNFPDGVATFMGGLGDLSVGASLAFAIAIHNIPEGIAVAVPVFYSTGNRHKAFLWGLMSGLAEPVGAGLCWLILVPFYSDVAVAVVHGIVAGMMVSISLFEMLPLARRYDPQNKLVNKCVIAGMVVMAASLVLFDLV